MKIAFAKARKAIFYPVSWCWRLSCENHGYRNHVKAYWVQYEGEKAGKKLTVEEFQREFNTIYQEV